MSLSSSTSIYQHVSNLKYKDMPYKPLGQSLGIHLGSGIPTSRVLANERGDCVRFNEAKNDYGQIFMEKIMDKMAEAKGKGAKGQGKSINTVSEQQTAYAVFFDETAELANEGGYAYVQPNIRHAKTIWYLVKGFNSDGCFNQELTKVLDFYAQIRIGLIPKKVDEFGAAVEALKLYHNTKITDNKKPGNGVWALTGVNLLDGHLIGRKMTRIAFHPNYDKDELIRTTERKENSTMIWTKNKDNELLPCMIETPPEVIAELIKFLSENNGNENFSVASCVGAPEEDEHDGPPRKRAKREFSLL